MPRNRELDRLMPPGKRAVQPYFSNRIQLADVIEWVISHIGPADLTISTFSTSEAFLRRLHRLRSRGMIRSCLLFCDLRAARKTQALYLFIKSVCDQVFLCENHSKVVLLSAGSAKVSIVTSQNQTRGDRFEAGVIINDTMTFESLSRGFKSLTDLSVSIDDLFVKS